VAIAVRRTPLEEMRLYLSYTRKKLKTVGRPDDNSSDRSTIILANYLKANYLTVAIAVRRTQLDIMLLYLSCARTKLKTAVQSTPARNCAKNDLFCRQKMMPSESLRPA
jgi:hypothetical protein